MQTTLINRDNAELNLKARTTNTLAAVRSAYWDYVYLDSGHRRGAASRSRSRRSCSRTTRFASRSARWRPMDVVQAEAEEATRQQTLTIGDRDDAHGRALAQAADRQRHERSAVVPAHRPDRSPRLSAGRRSTSKARCERRSGSAPICRSRATTWNRTTCCSSRSAIRPCPMSTRWSRTAPRALAARSTNLIGSGLDRIAQRHPVQGGYSNALSTLFNRDYPNWQFALQRELSDRRQCGRGAGRPHATADSAEPGADSRDRADGRDRSDQRRAAGHQHHRSAGGGARRRATCRSAGSTPR